MIVFSAEYTYTELVHTDSGTDSNDDKIDVEVRWAQSFSADDGGESRRFPNGGQFWRDTMLGKVGFYCCGSLPTSRSQRRLRRLSMISLEIPLARPIRSLPC
jgi:hypothetical protein